MKNDNYSCSEEDDMAKPIASSAVPSTKIRKNGSQKLTASSRDENLLEDIPLQELWAELVSEKDDKK